MQMFVLEACRKVGVVFSEGSECRCERARERERHVLLRLLELPIQAQYGDNWVFVRQW